VKLLILQIVILGLATALLAEDEQNFSITTNQAAEAKLKLEAYEKGTMTLKELTESGDENCKELISYYLLHTNDVSVKAKLPIGRCFAAYDKYPQAAQLAAEYVQIYSNDWHGWKILGGANLAMENYDTAIEPLMNAAKLGDEFSYAPLTFAALKLDRLNIVSNLVQHLFVLKKVEPPPEAVPLDIVTVLTLYSLKADRKDIFVKALDGVSAKQILSRDDLPQLVKEGCERFKGEDIDKIRQEMESATGSTNSVSSPPH
jgi:tetratricopeptide (TPR) repeat protein